MSNACRFVWNTCAERNAPQQRGASDGGTRSRRLRHQGEGTLVLGYRGYAGSDSVYPGRVSCVRSVRLENRPALPAFDWSVVRIYPSSVWPMWAAPAPF
eukprot:2570079-Pyramimonas_sp.AAC.1